MQTTTIAIRADERDLQRLRKAERHLSDALAAARESIARCEQALNELSDARLRIAHDLEPRAVTLEQPHVFPAPGETGDDICRDVHCADGLTAREVEVLRLVAAGHSNRVIADTLFISPRTVERHIANIYLKIDAHNKTEAMSYAWRHLT